MTASDFEAGAQGERPKSLSKTLLLRRAGFGLFVLVAGTAASVWLYDASLKANAQDQAQDQTPARIVSNR